MERRLVRHALRLGCVAAALTMLAPAGVGSGVLYAIRRLPQELWRIDLSTFEAILVGPVAINDFGEQGPDWIAIDGDGDVYGLSTSLISGSLYRLDKTTAFADELHLLGTSVGSHGADVDPVSGRFVWLDQPGFSHDHFLKSIDVQTFSTSGAGIVGGFVTQYRGFVFHPAGHALTTDPPTNMLWRVDPANPSGPGTLPLAPLGPAVNAAEGASLTFDGPTQRILGYARASHCLFEVNAATNAITVLHVFPASVPQFVGIAGDRCPGAMVPYGTGCPGTSGFVPYLSTSGCAVAGHTVTIRLGGGLGSSVALFVFGAQPSQAPIGAGCSLLVTPLPAPSLLVPLGPGGPGKGSAKLNGALPLYLQGATFTMQAFVADPASPVGGSATNGLRIDVN